MNSDGSESIVRLTRENLQLRDKLSAAEELIDELRLKLTQQAVHIYQQCGVRVPDEVVAAAAASTKNGFAAARPRSASVSGTGLQNNSNNNGVDSTAMLVLKLQQRITELEATEKRLQSANSELNNALEHASEQQQQQQHAGRSRRSAAASGESDVTLQMTIDWRREVDLAKVAITSWQTMIDNLLMERAQQESNEESANQLRERLEHIASFIEHLEEVQETSHETTTITSTREIETLTKQCIEQATELMKVKKGTVILTEKLNAAVRDLEKSKNSTATAVRDFASMTTEHQETLRESLFRAFRTKLSKNNAAADATTNSAEWFERAWAITQALGARFSASKMFLRCSETTLQEEAEEFHAQCDSLQFTDARFFALWSWIVMDALRMYDAGLWTVCRQTMLIASSTTQSHHSSTCKSTTRTTTNTSRVTTQSDEQLEEELLRVYTQLEDLLEEKEEWDSLKRGYQNEIDRLQQDAKKLAAEVRNVRAKLRSLEPLLRQIEGS